MKTILVTGSNGQLGQELQILAKSKGGIEFIFADRSVLDISSMESIRLFEKSFLHSKSLSGIINGAAYTHVDKAESEPDAARNGNIIGTKNLAQFAKQKNAKLIHVSTDFVFDGMKSRPYLEDDKKNPLSVYGNTKSEGEDVALNENSNSLIFRTSWVYSAYGKNFFKTIHRFSQERESLKVISDQVGTPTWARDLAEICLEGIESDNTGIYHFSNEGVASWYDFACEIVDAFGSNCNVIPITTEEYPTDAIRPSYSVLNKSKFHKDFKFQNSHWRKQVRKLASQFSLSEEPISKN
ncbi:dTDP-4-dehydrorhamnose reductase [Leptospira levettii]|uniref:dTDP-4-dehydrorhamnose reductase n=1 Tax=Leptospira levettii TaxID=2023178 RepID=UPI00223E4049|nr:dTDP-4-dehydrorhamnose reductase [Leptospira levettii]MCW7472082.1 dTDP-4-dehydrorhamnose reductase [Leptospira levettii]